MAKNRKKSRNNDYSEAEQGAGLPRAKRAKAAAQQQIRHGGMGLGRSTLPGGAMFIADRETVNALNTTAQIYAQYNVRTRAKPKNKRK